MFLIRKIDKGKWPKTIEEIAEIGGDIKKINADSVTSSLKTTKNALSTWEISDITKIDEAILALVSCQERCETFDVVVLEKQEVLTYGFEILDTEGKTPVRDLKNTHKDIARLNYNSIGEFALLVIDNLRRGNTQRFTKTVQKRILDEAIKNSKLTQNQLNSKLQISMGYIEESCCC